MNESDQKCPICMTAATIKASAGKEGYWDKISCDRCREFCIKETDILQNALNMDERSILICKDNSSSQNIRQELCNVVARCAYASKSKKNTNECRSVISHVLNKASLIDRVLEPQDFAQILRSVSLPSPTEQAINLISFLGKILSGVGDSWRVQENGREVYNLGALIGFRIGAEADDFYALTTALGKQGLIANDRGTNNSYNKPEIFSNISLTLHGWSKYEELQKSDKENKFAFVAMKFKKDGDKETDYFFQDVLLPKYLVLAIKDAGFKLINPLASEPKAGNIHARLELEIKNSRFVVAELSHHNNGAYWEAGFAKGLSKPVIYMFCKEIAGQNAPHFDVGSDQIIFWDKNEPEHAAQQLKTIIQNTLFGEALQNQ